MVDLDYNEGNETWMIDTNDTTVRVNGDEIDLKNVTFDVDGQPLSITLEDGTILDVSKVQPIPGAGTEDLQIALSDANNPIELSGRESVGAVFHHPTQSEYDFSGNLQGHDAVYSIKIENGVLDTAKITID